jgi:2',3'-cyclic-nucleotide 2'-phosphodiesterase
VSLSSLTELNILCVGDVCGKAGREVLAACLEKVQSQHNIDFTIVNLENAANGIGITPKLYKELNNLPIQAFTSGNHIFDKREILPKFNELDNVLRPLNYPRVNPGKGFMTFDLNGQLITVINLIGQVFMKPVNSPFEAVETLMEEHDNFESSITIVDFHKEATSEIQAMGYYLDGKVSAVYGTHTHVQTADERILEGGTGFISDLGMTGSENSILGMQKEGIITTFFTNMNTRKEPSNEFPYILNAIVLKVDTQTKKTVEIKRLYLHYYGFDDI